MRRIGRKLPVLSLKHYILTIFASLLTFLLEAKQWEVNEYSRSNRTSTNESLSTKLGLLLKVMHNNTAMTTMGRSHLQFNMSHFEL